MRDPSLLAAKATILATDQLNNSYTDAVHFVNAFKDSNELLTQNRHMGATGTEVAVMVVVVMVEEEAVAGMAVAGMVDVVVVALATVTGTVKEAMVVVMEEAVVTGPLV